jgi:hypothetical protein
MVIGCAAHADGDITTGSITTIFIAHSEADTIGAISSEGMVVVLLSDSRTAISIVPRPCLWSIVR